MSNRTERKQRERAKRRAAKAAAMAQPGYESNYARKSKYLTRHGGWGFDYPDPKPWKRADAA